VNDLLYFLTARRPPRSLDRRLNEQGALPIPEALAVARGIAAALAHAHERGVRHGDLRPKRVFLAGEMPVVGGFGLIEAVTAQGSDDARSTVLSFGAPAYQSPEQLAGEVAVDERSDVYTFGCICYEMLAGGPPFARPGRGASLGDKLTQPAPPLRARRETVPAALAELVHACLARVPADRPASGAHVLRALG
jgi:serine/threonine-protein kinase